MSLENENNIQQGKDASKVEMAGNSLQERGISIPQLRTALAGQIILPGDPEYDAARVVFYGGFDRRPALIARPANAADVAYIVSLARQTGIDLAVRSGGHSNAGYGSTAGGIVLDLRDMHAIQIDTASRTAWAETGLSAGEYTLEAAKYDLATGFGDTGSVGIGGLTLGGGVGYLVRKHGLTIDSLLAVELVTADGELLQVDAAHHLDLFWALRGGGGNFGVATHFKFKLHPVETIVGGMLILPATSENIEAFIAAAEAAPEELSAIANIMPAPPMPFLPEEYHGRLILLAMLVYAGEVAAGERAMGPFRALATPLVDFLKTMRYPEIFPPEEEDYHPTAVGHTMFIDKVDHDAARTMMTYLQESDAAVRVAQLRVLGGAMVRVPVEATAYAHRQARIMVNLAAFYDGPEDRAVRTAWVKQFAAALDQGYPGAYVNFLSDEGEKRIRAAYPGQTWDRLAAIKTRYDPGNLFHLNQNIPPKST